MATRCFESLTKPVVPARELRSIFAMSPADARALLAELLDARK